MGNRRTPGAGAPLGFLPASSSPEILHIASSARNKLECAYQTLVVTKSW